MERQLSHLQTQETILQTSALLENQLLATKFYVPTASHHLIARPRLTALLNESLKFPLMLISAPAGFGKTTLLSTWTQSLPVNHPCLCWVSLDGEDNEPRLFWAYVLTALNRFYPQRFTPLLMQLQSTQVPPLKYVLTALINVLAEGAEQFLLILDDYHVITEQEVHTTLSYLVEHLPPQLHIVLATRADPPLSLSLLQSRRQILEVRTEQLRCTAEETRAFFEEVIGTQLPDEIIQEVTTRTEGWLVGLQLLGLSQQGGANPATLLEEASGDQRYILDYLTEEVLGRQPPDVQMFLLSTCILERLNASLCNAVMEQTDSQQMLHQLEQANLFVVSLDSKRQWYRYHALFAEALRYQLEQMQADRMLLLHYRASLWYDEHHQTAEAILHAFHAHQWQWTADLIERLSVLSLTWGASEHALALLRQWLEQLPVEVVHARPRLCLACVQLLWTITPYPKLEAWLNAAETMLTASLTNQTSEDISNLRLAQEDLLGEVIASRAFLLSTQEDGKAALALCQQALALLSADNHIVRALVAWAQLRAYDVSSANDTVAAIQYGQQAISLAQMAGKSALAITLMGTVARHMIGAGQLHEIQRLTQQAIQIGTLPGGILLPEVGYPATFQADILREWNKLDAALSRIEEAIELCKQTELIMSITYSLHGYGVLLRIYLSRGELDAARSALQQFERIGMRISPPFYLHMCSLFTTIERVRLWLACGELKRAMRWVQELDLQARHGSPFAHEREEVARVRILLATAQPDVAQQRLLPLLARATKAQRWGHVIEMQILQTLAHQMCQEETLALDALSAAIHLAEPEGYIRCFVDEGPPMAALLSKLHKEQGQYGPTPYLDTLLAAFPQPSKIHERQSKQVPERTKSQPLLDPLSAREREVLQLLASGASNQEIAQELVIVINTVKRHVSHIFAKLGVQNRIQAVRKAKELGLLE